MRPLGNRCAASSISSNEILKIILGAVLDNEIYLRWHDEEKPVKLAQATAAY